ncbi:MAG: hypothetical protein PUD43_06005 [Clostridia bacterium]|nr:hypothetical protein [Clostridia bacterium]
MKAKNKKNFVKRVVSVILAVMLIAACVPAVFADERIINIETAEDLEKLAENCTLDSWSRGVTVVLKNNINVRGSSFKQIPTFGGRFEGNGYTVSGLYIEANEPVQGFFRYVQEGSVVDGLTVKGDIKQDEGESTFGGIAGVNEGTITNCTFDGTVDGKSIVGGIAGINESGGRIGNCINDGTINGEKYTGGIAGENFGSVLRCVNRGKINTSSEESKTDIQDISLDDTNAAVSEEINPLKGHTDTGGIAGYSNGIIQSCQNYGSIGYQHLGYNIGGIVGRQTGYVNGCVNHSQVLGRKDVGGIVGQAEPHIILRYSSDTLQQLDDALDDMQSLVNGMLDHIDATTNTVSARVEAITDCTDAARDSSKELMDEASDYMDDIKDFANDNIEVINDMSARITDTFDRLVPVIEDIQDISESTGDIIDDLAYALEEIADSDGIGKDMKKSLEKAAEHLAASKDSVNNALEKVKKAAEAVLNAAVSGDNEKLNAALLQLKSACEGLSAALEARKAAVDEIRDIIENAESLPLSDEERKQLAECLAAIAENTGRMAVNSVKIGAAVIKIAANADIDKDDIKEALGELSGISEDMEQAVTEVINAVKDTASALKNLKKLPSALDDIIDTMADTLDGISDTSDSMTSAVKKIKRIMKDLADDDPIEFKTLDSDYHLDTQSLHDSLTDLSEQVRGLNTDLKNSEGLLTSDIRAINNQFNVIMDILIDAVTDNEDKELSDLTMDTSDTDIHKTTEGKIENCSNFGRIEADLGVGGIAGAMGIEYDLDPEDDISSVGSRSLNFRYETKAVLLGCKNYGNITSKKNYVGGVVGKMDMGTAAECEGYGYIESTGGDYIGGIAGISESVIRDSFAKCILSGRSCIGGIAGGADTVENCRSIISIEDSIGRVGATVGEAKDIDNIKNNSFVNTGWAGVGGISYEGRSVPMTYEQMNAQGGLPDEFLEFTLKFVANGSLIKTVPFTFGEDLSDMELPEVPERDGYYGSWPDTDLSHMTFSTVLEAEYKPWVTVLTSSEAGEGTDKALALAQGVFTEDDNIAAQYTETETMPGGVTEGETTAVIEVSINSGNVSDESVTELRLLKPDGVENADVWALKDGKWSAVKAEDNGSYVITELEGTEGVFCIAPSSEGIMKYVAAAVLLLILILLFIRKKRKGAKIVLEGEEAKMPKTKKRLKRKNKDE